MLPASNKNQEAEIINLNLPSVDNILTPTQANGYQIVMPAMELSAAVERRKMLVAFTQKLMVPGKDYGVIPGTTDKPTLLKPGAEKLLNYFGLTTRFEIINDVKDWTGEHHNGEPFFHYEIRSQIFYREQLIAEGFGCCNSWEKKFRYRNAKRVCPSCHQPAIMLSKFNGGYYCNPKQGGCGKNFPANDPQLVNQQDEKISNPDIADQVNTILKIAKKRAFIDATLLAVNASEFFSQDLEDFAEAEVVVSDNGKNGQATGVEDISDETNKPVNVATRDELLSVLRVLFERLNLKKYAVAYTQYLVEKYGIKEIGELTVAHINEQIWVLQKCVGNKRKLNQLTKILGAVKVAG
jgi:hypothetical protein